MNRLVLIFIFSLTTACLYGQNCNSTIIHFRSNKLKLKKHHIETIDSIINSLSLDTNYLIEIHGHTDDKKSEEYNLELGFKRANAVSSFIEEKRRNVVIIEKSFGESEPTSTKDRENRRVQIFTVPINEDSTITIHGKFKETMKLNYRYFRYCGYCLSKPEIKSTRPIGYYESDRDINVSIDLDCKSDINCFSVEYRFPYSYFNNSDSIMIPKPLYSYGCSTNLRDRDSIDAKKDERFDISYDTITNEYIITQDCFTPNYPGICCGTKPWPCPSYTIHFNNDQNSLYNAISKHRYQGDTLIRLGDSLLLKPKLCLNRLDTLYSIAKYQNELVFFQSSMEKLPSDTTFDWKGFTTLYIDAYIDIEKYEPLPYSNAKIKVKIFRNPLTESIGYYLENYNHFIKLNQISKRKYTSRLLIYPFVYGGDSKEGIYSFAKHKIKVKYRKRKNLYKYKIKKRLLNTEE